VVKHKSKPKSNILWKTILILPDKYSLWLTQKGCKLPTPDVLKYINKNKISKSTKILFPDNNDVFAIDPILDIKHQQIKLRASFPADMKKAVWIINKKKIVKLKYPYFHNWQIKRGHYRLRFVVYLENGEIIKSREVSFIVN
jgi:hypothetical protein